MGGWRGGRELWRRRYAARRLRTNRLARFGSDSVIVPPATILAPDRIEIGSQVLVFEHAVFSVVEEFRGRTHTPRLRIGDRTVVGPRVWFSCVGSIDIGSDVLIGTGALIADSFHEYADRTLPISMQPMGFARGVRVEDGAFIGPGAALLAGAVVGTGAYIVPNAVVAGHVPPHSVAAGNPAQVVRRWDPEAEAWIDDPDSRWRDVIDSVQSGGPDHD